MRLCRRAVRLMMGTNIENSTLRKASGSGQLCPHFSMIPGIAERTTPTWKRHAILGARVNNQALQQPRRQLFTQHYGWTAPERHSPLGLTNIMQQRRCKHIPICTAMSQETSTYAQRVSLVSGRHCLKKG